MAKVKLDPSVINENAVDSIEDAIWDAIHQASGRMSGQQGISDDMEDAAQRKIVSADAIWTGELLESFEASYQKRGDTLRIRLENDSDHARPINFGAEYGSKGPPVAALIPWVAAHMGQFPDIPDDDLPDKTRADVEELDGPTGTVTIPEGIDSLIVERAFWVQRQIKEHGIDAVEFMDGAKRSVMKDGPDTLADYIEQNFKLL